jgi:chemotaxis protein histidine kinase CheA
VENTLIHEQNRRNILVEIDMSTQENALAAKLSGAKISEEELERRLAAANKDIEGASAGFTDWAGADVAEAMAALEKLENESEAEGAKNLVFRVAHDLKGQGTTFGYPLATQIAGLLCDYIRSTESSPPANLVDVIGAHLAALNLILKQEIKGDGDAAAQQLVEKLTLAAARVKQKE